MSRQKHFLLLVCSFCFIFSGFSARLNVQAESPADRLQTIFDRGWALESRMHIDLANLDRAIALYEEAVAIAPDNAEARWRLAEVTFKKSEETPDKQKRKEMVTRSLALAESALKLNPKSVGGMYWAGVALARLADMSGILTAMKQIKQAKAYLHEAIRTDPDHRLSILSGVILALIYSESPWPLKDMDQALELARWSVDKDPNLTIATLSLGKIYLAEGETGLAEKFLKQCLDTQNPTYVWDSKLYDWPEAKSILAGLEARE
jgi:tetratricopeptide (TPR) repeat protein